MTYRAWAIGVAVLALAGGVARGHPTDAVRSASFQPTGAPVTPADSTAFPDSVFLPPPAPDSPLPQQVIDADRVPPDFATWLTAEWVVGVTSGPSLLPVATTGPASAGPLAGAVGQPGTVPLFGGGRVLNDWRSGLLVGAGVWFDPQHTTGIDARFYSLFSQSERFGARPDGSAVVNVPQFVPVGGTAVQVPAFVGFPGLTAGTVAASVMTTFLGGDVNLRHLLDSGPGYRLDLLAGYRQLHLSDRLDSNFTITPTGANPLLPLSLSGLDSVHTRNDFFGPQLGFVASTTWNRFTLEGRAASALGVTVSNLDFVHARSAVFPPAAPPPPPPQQPPEELRALAAPGALGAAVNQFPLNSAAAKNTLNYLGVVAEGGLRLGWQATDHLRLTAGYTFIYWNNVRRAEEMYTGGPVLRARAIDFATHLLSLGLDVRF